MTRLDLDFAADHYALFGLDRRQGIDLSALDALYREVQARVHPDKHANAADADQRLAMQWATRINEAYRTLKSPLTRARYLLGLLGHDAKIESNTAMPAGFLVEQMELREAVADAKAAADDVTLDGLRERLTGEIRSEYQRLQSLIDGEQDYAAATVLVRQLMFQEKLLHEIDDALEAVLN